MAEPGSVEPVDVVLVDLNEVLTGIVAGVLEREPHIRIVALVRSCGSLRTALAGTTADVAIVGADGDRLDRELRELVCARPRLRALAVGGDGINATLYELGPQRAALGELSPATLLDAIAGLSPHGCAGHLAEGAA